MAEQPPFNPRATERLTVAEAAARLGITESAVRGRINRGTLEVEREEGTVYVRLSADYSNDYPGESSTLISRLEDEVVFLRRELERQQRQAEERDRENRRLLAAALERIPPQLVAPAEAPSAAPSDAEPTDEQQGGGPPRSDAPGPQAGPQRRPWWRRLSGG